MFNEDEDWNDDENARVLSKTVLNNTLNTTSSSNVKTKVVGKKSLLQTLQTLGSVPDWKSDKHEQDSDSETEVAPLQDEKKKKKRKKKRRKRQKQAEGTGEQQENGDLHETVEEEKPTVKKRKKDKEFKDSKVTNTSESDTKDKEMNIPANQPDSENKLSRQQWKNKMKNKKKCKNKFRQNQPEEGVKKDESAEKAQPKEEGKSDSCRDNNSEKNIQTTAKKKEKKPQPQKRKKTEDDTDTSFPAGTLTEEQQVVKKKKTTDEVGTKQKTEEPEAAITDNQHQLPMKKPKPELTKWEKQKREKLQKILQSKATDQQESPVEVKEEPSREGPVAEVKEDRSASLRSRMEQRLESARFRYINEVLYSTSSGEAKRMFKQDPQAFGIYHRGYTAQVQKWPVNPVDRIIDSIRQKSPSLVVADFGCGDCKIARSVKNKVHSFDLAATCELVTVCDMAHVPLPDGSVDIAVFCLSLMGTNLADFLSEANRVLKMGGVLKIAEVASRFDNVRSFTSALSSLGFKMVSTDTENSHFYSFEFKKTGDAPDYTKKVGLQLRPCVYKKR